MLIVFVAIVYNREKCTKIRTCTDFVCYTLLAIVPSKSIYLITLKIFFLNVSICIFESGYQLHNLIEGQLFSH